MSWRRYTAIPIAALAISQVPACETTTRVISVRGGLQNIEGAEGGIKPDVQGGGKNAGSIGSLAASMYGPLPGIPVDGNELRRELENGDILLVSRTPGELVYQLRRTIRDEEWDLIYEQLLSAKLKQAYEDLNKDPLEAGEFVRRHSRQITEMLTMMPAADQTPGVGFQGIGRNAYRLTIPGGQAIDTTFRSMDIVYENRQFRLRMLN